MFFNLKMAERVIISNNRKTTQSSEKQLKKGIIRIIIRLSSNIKFTDHSCISLTFLRQLGKIVLAETTASKFKEI